MAALWTLNLEEAVGDSPMFRQKLKNAEAVRTQYRIPISRFAFLLILLQEVTYLCAQLIRMSRAAKEVRASGLGTYLGYKRKANDQN
jgi:hypothetical protein